MFEARTPLGFYKSGRPIYPILGGAEDDNPPRRRAAEAKSRLRRILEAAKSDNRPLSEDEAARARGLKETIAAETKAADELDHWRKELDELGAADDPNGDRSKVPDDSKGDKLANVKGTTWTRAAVGAFQKAADRIGSKAVIGNEVTVPSAIDPAAPLPTQPTRLLDLVPKVGITMPGFQFLQQVAKQNNAAAVADTNVKPTSTMTFEPREDRVRYVAHLSEAMPIRFLSDYNELANVLDSQMVAGVLEEVERLIVDGSGAGEEWTGILSTTGTTAVPFVTDLLTTCRHARSVLEHLGEVPTAWVFNPDDLESIDLMRENADGSGAFLVDSAAATTIFGDYPRISSTAVAAGTAVLADWRQMEVKVLENASTLVATQAGDLWETNQCILRTEGRYGFKFTRPQAAAVVDLAAV